MLALAHKAAPHVVASRASIGIRLSFGSRPDGQILRFIRAYSITPDVGANVPKRMHDEGHAKEDMYFRAEDVKQLSRLTKLARAQARAKGVETDVEEVWRTDVEEVRKIVGHALSDNVVKKLIEWKHHH